jgi:DNA-binding transcriptional regulator YdaS (Cro superfamily)
MDIDTFIFSSKITKRRMARELGISEQYLSGVAKRRYKPSDELAGRVEMYTRGFVKSTELLAGWEKEPKPDPLEKFFEENLKPES